MILRNFVNGEFVPVLASMFTHKGKKHYNVKIGNSPNRSENYTIGVSDTLVGEVKEPIISLDGSYYTLMPIWDKHRNQYKTNAKGYSLYYVSFDNSAIADMKALLVLNLPQYKKEVAYTPMRNTAVIGVGKTIYIGKQGDPITIDTPVLLMSEGDSVLVRYTESNDEQHSFTIVYKNNNFIYENHTKG